MDVFVKRTAHMICDHRKRARKHRTEIDYGIEEFRDLVRKALNDGLCPYCGTILTECNFSADHGMPVSRNGAQALANLIICCSSCNEAKGSMTASEFKLLMSFLRTQTPLAMDLVLRRLRDSSRHYQTILRHRRR